MANAGTAAQATQRAIAAIGHHNTPGMCLFYVRIWCGAPGGFPTAILGWTGAKYKHPKDANPPSGVPVWWSDKSAGHVALSIGGGKIVSTDWPQLGTTGQTTIANLTAEWHKTYLGWTEDIDNARIQGIGGATAIASPVGSPIGNPLDFLNQLKQIFTWSSDANNWIRVGLFLGGLILCVIAIWRMMKTPIKSATNTTKSVAGKVMEYASAAKA